MRKANRMRWAPHSAQGGITLIELMIVVVIVGILAAIAYPSYQGQVRKARRAEGKTLLLELASKQERFFTENNSYTNDMTDLGYTNNVPQPTENGWYDVSVTAVGPGGCAPGAATACTAFTLRAVARNDQTHDKCGSLTVNQFGVKGKTGTATDCW